MMTIGVSVGAAVDQITWVEQQSWGWGFRNGLTGGSYIMLKGKVAVVTGSTSGIGLGIARALAAGGRIS
jgi:hypothetical protein